MSKIYYCPRCGRLEPERYYKIADFCTCEKVFCLFSTKLLPIEEEYESFDLDQPMTRMEFTKEMYDLVFDKYVFNPMNKKINRSAANEQRRSVEEFFASGEDHNPRHRKTYTLDDFLEEERNSPIKKEDPIPPLKPGQCPACHSIMVTIRTSCFDPAGSIIGATLFGEPGAVFGAIGEERTYHVCQKCGYKW